MGNDDSIRLADVPVPKIWVAFWRSWAFPIYWLMVLLGLRRERRKTRKAITELGEAVSEVVAEAKRGSLIVRRLTYAIAALTLINTAFVIYSVLR